jgi:hypothetical protein
MKLTDIPSIRLQNQQIATTKFKNPKELVHWMGAMQAQDYNMVKWAVGIRLPGSTNKTIESAIDKGEIIRTHLMRPTWHLIAAEDIYWMLELTAPQILSSSRSRHKELELTDGVIKKSNALIEKALTKEENLTREEMVTEFKKAKISTGDNRAAHLLMLAELTGLICSGATKGNKQTYALLAKRVPEKKSMTRKEALTLLAKKYFFSHAPATLKDFVWWSGLPVADAKYGLESNKSLLISETTRTETYWFPASFSIPESIKESVHLLPAYDEFIISYKNRDAVLDGTDHKKAVSNNGIFRPVILINGKASGIWKRTINKDSVIIETEFFRSHTKKEISTIEKASGTYGNFLEKKPEIIHDV